MIDAVIKTFVIAHDQDTDEHLAQALVFNAGRLAWRMREAEVDRAEKRPFPTWSQMLTTPPSASLLARWRPCARGRHRGRRGDERGVDKRANRVVDPVDGTYNFSCGSDYCVQRWRWSPATRATPSSCISARCTTSDGLHPVRRAGHSHHPRCQAFTAASRRPLPHTGLGTYLHPTYLGQVEVRNAWLSVSTRCASIRMLGPAALTWREWRKEL